MDKKYNYKIFVSFVIPYIIILLIAVSAVGLTANKFINIVKQNLMQTNYSVLVQARDNIDNWMYEVETMANQLALNNNINNIIYSENSNTIGNYNYKLYEIIKNLVPYSSRSEIIDNYFIYLKNGNYMITQEAAYPLDFFYECFFKSENFSYEMFEKFFLVESNGKYFPKVPVMSHSNPSYSYAELDSIFYVRTIPLRNLKEALGSIMIVIKESELEKILQGANTSNSNKGSCYIIDENKQVVTSGNNESDYLDIAKSNFDREDGYDEINIDGEKIFIATVSSNQNKWKYVMVMPSESIINQANSFKKLITAITICALLIGILISIRLAMYNSKPLRNVLKRLGGIQNNEYNFNNTGNAYEYLENTLVNLVNKSTEFQELINQQTPLMYVTFFDRLFKGLFNNQKEILPFSSYVKVDLEGSQYAVVVIKMYTYQSIEDEDSIEELGVSKVIIKQAITQELNGEGYIYDVDENNIAMLIISKENNKEHFKTRIQNVITHIYDLLHKEYNMSIFSGIGSIYNDMMHISASFQEAMQVLERKKKEQKFIWFDEIPQKNETYYFPSDIKQRIINFTKSGEITDLELLFININEENFEKRHLSNEMFKQLIYEMRGTLVQFLMQSDNNENIHNTLSDIDAVKALHDKWDCVCNKFKNNCIKIDNQKLSHNIQLKEQIIEYIKEAYKSANLSRYDVAAKFSLTEAYLSRFFKEQTGENFSNYLENLRIEQACTLLNATELTIQEISEQVGYNSVYSFRRAFKRVKGISPSGLRE